MELKLPIYQVEVAMPNFLLQGEFQPRGDALVYLNDQSFPYLRFDKATLSTLWADCQVPHIRQPSIALSRQQISYVAMLEAESAQRIQLLQAKRPTLFYTDWCAIRGELHVNAEARDDDLLGLSRDFFAVSNASIFPLRPVTAAPAAKVPLVMVNRHTLSAYHVQQPKGE
jgi:hypothetical protein